MKRLFRHLRLSLLLIIGASLQLAAQSLAQQSTPSLWNFAVRAGLHVGATTPVPTPRALDHIYVWYPHLNPMIQLSASRRLQADSPWSVSAGITFEKKGMEATTRVKDMQAAIISDSPYAGSADEEYSGLFTGDNNTLIRLGYLTVPLQAVYHTLSDRLLLRGGIYASLLLESTFKVIIDGTMVYDDPLLGVDQLELRQLDFSDKIKGADFGLVVGADYYFTERLGAFADVTFGLLPVTGSDFRAIPYAMHNVFACVGFTYRFGR
ncbi:porin family protein [Porphyromonas loveana]|uniref:porin family protein n=1 Tax=Porphyromonas loveana TaxID=1884669 RepID=UPI00359F779E